MGVIKGTTSTGFDFEFEEEKRYDWEMMEAIAMSESEDASDKIRGSVAIVQLLLGDKKKDLLTHVRALNNGFAPSQAVLAEVTEMLSYGESGKK